MIATTTIGKHYLRGCIVLSLSPHEMALVDKHDSVQDKLRRAELVDWMFTTADETTGEHYSQRAIGRLWYPGNKAKANTFVALLFAVRRYHREKHLIGEKKDTEDHPKPIKIKRTGVYEAFTLACSAEGIDPGAIMYGLRRTPQGSHRRNAADVADRKRVWKKMRTIENPPSLIRMAGLFGVSHSSIVEAVNQ